MFSDAIAFPPATSPGGWLTDNLRLWDGPQRGQPFKPLPFQVGILDAWADPAVHTIVTQKCAQSGISTIMFGLMAYSAVFARRPMIMYLPTDGKAEETAKEKLAPLVTQNSAISSIITDDTISIKHFPGGYMAVLGTENENNLSARTVPFLFFDEVDRMKDGKEGCPISVGTKRSQQYQAEKKRFICSTPTIDGNSKVQEHFALSDKRLWNVPCPHCGTFQPLDWSNVGWQKDPRTGASLPHTAYYQCAHCAAQWTDDERRAVIGRGYWQATAPSNGTAGFLITSLMLPFLTLAEMATEYVQSKGNFAARQAFYNTVLGLPWREADEAIDPTGLVARRDPYTPTNLPQDIIVITAAGDIQTSTTHPRVEVEIVGWDKIGRSWSIDYVVVDGSINEVRLWQALEEQTARKFRRADGAELPITAFALDCSDGNVTTVVTAECSRRSGWFAIKGVDGVNKPIWDAKPGAVRNNKNISFWRIGTDAARTRHLQNLRITDPTSPGYCFFPNSDLYADDYFKQLVNKRKVNKGNNKRGWDVVDKSVRHEAFDVRVYNIALFEMVKTQFNLAHIERNITNRANNSQNPAKKTSPKINKMKQLFGAHR